MFLSLLSKEVRQQLMTFRFAAALITTFVLVVVSVLVLGNDYLRRRDAHNLAVERSARQNAEVYVPTQISPTLHRPPSPMSIFAQGEDRRFGNSVRIQRWEVPREATESFTDNMLLASLPPLDLYTIFAIVISLFGILLTYDGIAGERENGTLRFICAGAFRRGKIFGTKFLAGVICLSLPFLFSLTAGLICIVFIFGISYTASQWLAIALMVLGGLLYGGLFVALGLACSSLVRTSSAALVLALLLWALGVLVIPGAAQSVAGIAVPLPSAMEISSMERAIFEETEKKVDEFAEEYPQFGSGWTGGWGGSGYWKYDGSVEQHRHAEEFVRFIEPLMLSQAQKVWNLFTNHEGARRRQAAVAAALSAPAPVQYLRGAFNALAGTALSANDRFLEIARRYRAEMVDSFKKRGYFSRNALRFVSRRDRRDIAPGLWQKRLQEYRALATKLDTETFRKTVGIEAWGPLPRDEIPAFTPPGVEPDFAAAAWPLAFLAFVATIIFVVGFVAFLRYDVR